MIVSMTLKVTVLTALDVSEFVLLELHHTDRHRNRVDHQTVHCKPCKRWKKTIKLNSYTATQCWNAPMIRFYLA